MLMMCAIYVTNAMPWRNRFGNPGKGYSETLEPADVLGLLKKWRSVSLPPEKLVDLLSSTLHPLCYYAVGWTPDGDFTLVALSEREAEPEAADRKGDRSHAGVWVHVGSNVSVAPYVLRFVSLNGLSLPPKALPAGISPSDFDAALADLLREQHSKAEELLARYVRLAREPVIDVDARVDALCAELGVGRTVRDEALDYLEWLETVVTEYDILNALHGFTVLDPRLSEFLGRVVMSSPPSGSRA